MSRNSASTLLALALWIGFAASSTESAFAGSFPRLVVDIEPVAEVDFPNSVDIVQIVDLAGRAYFQADDGIHGRELWSTDGTPQGTSMLLDLCPGLCPGRPQFLTRIGDWIYFRGDDGVHGAELWRTNGTALGTELVADVREGLPASGPDQLMALDHRLFFQADDGRHGKEPWISDGTLAGTFFLANTLSDPNPTFLRLRALGVVANQVLFAGNDEAHGLELWATDGTPGGTQMIADINPGPAASMPNVEAGFGPNQTIGPDGNLYFRAGDSLTGRELWTSDGTPQGTRQVADVLPGPDGSDPQELCWLASRVLFSASSQTSVGELWATDGTALGTVPVLAEAPGAVSPPVPKPVVRAGEIAYFVARDGGGVLKLWTTDGTADGTAAVKTFEEGLPFPLSLFTGSQMHALGERVVFFGVDPAAGLEPWVSDGTAAGTFRLRDVNPGVASSLSPGFFGFFDLDDQLLTWQNQWWFRVHLAGRGEQLWTTDGTAEGTVAVTDADRQTSSFLPLQPSSGQPYPTLLERAGARLIAWAGDTTSGLELWSSDGTEAKTYLLADSSPGPSNSQLLERAALPNRLILSLATGANDLLTLSTDGTIAGTLPIPTGDGTSLSCSRLSAGHGRVYCENDGRIWWTDGLTAQLVAQFPGSVFELAATSTSVFIGTSEAGSSELWGFIPGGPTSRLASGFVMFGLSDFVAAGNLLFFKGDDGAHGRELWVSDGTVAGTRRATDLQPGPLASLPGNETASPGAGRPRWAPVAVGDRAFFVADDGFSGRELWVSDGTELGTHRVADLNPVGSSDPQELVACDGLLCFVAYQPASGRELWVTDGSEAGTRLLADLVAGPASSLPQSLSWQDNHLYFSAWTAALGREPWKWSPQEDPALVGDVAPGPASSSPTSFRWAAGQIFFVANDGTSGFELWSVKAASLFSDGFETGDFSGWSTPEP